MPNDVELSAKDALVCPNAQSVHRHFTMLCLIFMIKSWARNLKFLAFQSLQHCWWMVLIADSRGETTSICHKAYGV